MGKAIAVMIIALLFIGALVFALNMHIVQTKKGVLFVHEESM